MFERFRGADRSATLARTGQIPSARSVKFLRRTWNSKFSVALLLRASARKRTQEQWQQVILHDSYAYAQMLA